MCGCRLLGSTEIQLQEVVSRGKHSVTKTLKGKKGDMLTVRRACVNMSSCMQATVHLDAATVLACGGHMKQL